MVFHKGAGGQVAADCVPVQHADVEHDHQVVVFVGVGTSSIRVVGCVGTTCSRRGRPDKCCEGRCDASGCVCQRRSDDASGRCNDHSCGVVEAKATHIN